MKKCAILLSLVLLVSSVASLGLTASAGTTDGTVVFESDFSTVPEGVYAMNVGTTYQYYGSEEGDVNGVVNGQWVASTGRKLPNAWLSGFSVYGATGVVLQANRNYEISFDYTYTYDASATSRNGAFRLFADRPSNNPNDDSAVKIFKYYDIATGKSSNSGSCTIKLSEMSTNDTSITDCSAIRFTFMTKNFSGFTVDNLRIVDLTSVAEDTAEGITLLDSNFNTQPTAVTDFSDAASGRFFRSVAVANGVLSCTAPNNAENAWHNIFSVGKDNPFMVWESAPTGNNVYKIEFDWALPTGTTANADVSAEFRMLIFIEGTEDRIVQPTIFKGVQRAGTSVHYEATINFNGTGTNVDGISDYKVYLAFLAKYVDNLTIDNLKITDLSPAITNKGAQKQQVAEGATTTALRYGFDLACTGVTKAADHSRVIADNATVTLNGKSYKLVDFGALLSTNEEADLTMNSAYDIYGIRAYNLYNVEDGVVTYTVGVSNMPVDQPGKMLYARAYVTYELADGTQLTAYGEKVAYCLNDAN